MRARREEKPLRSQGSGFLSECVTLCVLVYFFYSPCLHPHARSWRLSCALRARSAMWRLGLRGLRSSSLLCRGAAVSSCCLLSHNVLYRASCEPTALSVPPQPAEGAEKPQRAHGAGVSIKDLSEGEGERADYGMWVAVHYTVRVLGDDSIIADTRTTGHGDRDYGRPEQFLLGELQNESVLRALHLCTLAMQVGGRRRIRVTLGDADFGYIEVPLVLDSQLRPRLLKGDWLMDVEVTLVSVRPERPSRWERTRQFFDTFGRW